MTATRNPRLSSEAELPSCNGLEILGIILNVMKRERLFESAVADQSSRQRIRAGSTCSHRWRHLIAARLPARNP